MKLTIRRDGLRVMRVLRVSVYERRVRIVDVHWGHGDHRQLQRSRWQGIVLASRHHIFVVGSVSGVIASATLAPIRLDRCLQLLLGREVFLLSLVRVQIFHIPVDENMIRHVHICDHGRLISVIRSNVFFTSCLKGQRRYFIDT